MAIHEIDGFQYEAQPSVVRSLGAGGLTRSHMSPRLWEKNVTGRRQTMTKGSIRLSSIASSSFPAGFWRGRIDDQSCS